jgi:putative endonuclease
MKGVICMVHQRRRFGNWGEEAAVRYLEKQGYEILDRNYRSSWGEIDIIARHWGVLAFVEVKTRHSLKFGRPAAAVTRDKQIRLRKTAWCYLRENPVIRYRSRFDIIEILDLYGKISLNHLKNCF